MSVELMTTITINATTEQVWDVLTDFSAYGEWSNFSSVTGVAVAGSRLAIRMPGLSFRPTVTIATPGQELQWAATIVTTRLFYGQHSFRLSATPDGTTLLTNSELFSGATVAPFRRLLEQSVPSSGYAAFNHAIKARVEKVVARMPRPAGAAPAQR